MRMCSAVDTLRRVQIVLEATRFTVCVMNLRMARAPPIDFVYVLGAVRYERKLASRSSPSRVMAWKVR